MTPETLSRVWERLRPFRFERDRPLRAFVAVPAADPAVGDAEPARAPADGTTAGPVDGVDVLLEAAQSFGLPLVLEANDGGGFRGLAGDRVVLDDWLRRASATHHVGLSASRPAGQ